MNTKATSFMQIILAGFLSFLGAIATAQIFLFLFWLFGKLNPNYQLITGVIAGCIGLYVGGWITVRVMNSKDVWFSAFNGLLVGGASIYFLIGITPLAVAITVLSFVFSGLGGYTAIQRLESKTK